MHKKLPLLVIALMLALSGCSFKNRDEDVKRHEIKSLSKGTENQGSITDQELTGVLRVLDPEKCPLVEGCGPRFSLLGRKFETRVAIKGDISPEHNNIILTVIGSAFPLPDDLVGKSGYENINAMFQVKQYQLRSTIPYYPFLVSAAAVNTRKKFGCELLWDKSYSWTIQNNVPRIRVRMTDTFSAEPQPWVELTYNGDSGNLIKMDWEPKSTNPCTK